MLFSQSSKGGLSLFEEAVRRDPQLPHLPAPRLAVLWGARSENFTESLLVLLRGPVPPKQFLGAPYFRDCWVAGPRPDRALVISSLWHVAFVFLLVQLWPLLPSPPRIVRPQVEIAYYGPINDLPAILPARSIAPTNPKRITPTEKSLPPRGADAYHPRQTIVNNPLRPNHPRQTLIQPLAPPEPPKILPALPNIVAWQELAKPNLRIDPATLARLKPQAPSARQDQVAAPELANQEKLVGVLNVAELDAPSKPALPIRPMSAPKTAARQVASQAAPEPDIGIASDTSGTRLIALSATPAPEMPPAVPSGNLSSRISISPEGRTPGEPEGSPSGSPVNGARGSAESSGEGPAGLSISGGGKAVSPLSGVGRGAAGSANPRTPGVAATPAAVAPIAPRISAAASSPNPFLAAIKPGTKPETLLGGRPIFTLHVNMPNLTSAMGSWVLTFAELGTMDGQFGGVVGTAGLSGPEPLRKVDPKYPPELRSHHVEGEVVLYAVIRKDGTVDSIQLIEGVDPTLDENAMQALAQWKFRPAEREGTPIDLEAIVRIPFRSVMPLYR